MLPKWIQNKPHLSNSLPDPKGCRGFLFQTYWPHEYYVFILGTHPSPPNYL